MAIVFSQEVTDLVTEFTIKTFLQFLKNCNQQKYLNIVNRTSYSLFMDNQYHAMQRYMEYLIRSSEDDIGTIFFIPVQVNSKYACLIKIEEQTLVKLLKLKAFL